MKRIDIGNDFSPRLTNRDTKQRDGKFNAIDFREKFLTEIISHESWQNDEALIELDFKNVTKMGPSWANEVFAFFTKFAKPETILKKIKVINISRVKLSIINQELEAGYKRK